MVTQGVLSQTPIYRGGELVGIEDPIKKMTRLPTEFEKRIFEKKSTPSISDVQLRDVKLPDKIQETYDPRLGAFISTRPEDQFGTSIVTRQPTIEERQRIEQAQYKGDLYGKAITGVPAQMVGGIFTTPLTDKEIEETKGLGFFNPKKQFEIYKGVFDYERDLKEAEKISDKLGKLNIEYEKKTSKVSKELKELEKGNIKDGKWIGLEKDLDKYNKLVEDYNKESKVYSAKFEGYSEMPEYSNVLTSERKDFYERIAESKKLTEKQKGILSFGVSAVDFALWRVPVVRTIRGADFFSGGLNKVTSTKDSKENLLGLGEMALGGVLIKSGLGSSISKGSSFLGGTSRLAKVSRGALTWGLPSGIGVGYGISIGKRTESIPVGVGAGLGAFAGLKSPELYKFGKKGFDFLATKLEGDVTKAPKRLYTGSAQIFASEQVTVVDEYGNVIRVSAAEAKARGLTVIPSRAAMVSDFQFYPKDYQKKFIKSFFENKVYLDEISLKKDVARSMIFLKDAGLSNAQIKSILKEVVPQLFTVTTPAIQSKGGLTITKSGLTQVGTMETQVGKVTPAISLKYSLFSKEKLKVKQLDSLKLKSFELSILDSKTTQKQEQPLAIFSSGITKQKEETKQLSLLALPQLSKQIQKKESVPIQIFKQLSKAKQTTSLDLITKSTFDKSFKDPIKPKEPTGIGGFGFFGKSSGEKKKELLDEDEFEVFVKKRGKDILIGEFTTLPEARKKLRGELKETLRASGFISKGKKKLTFEEIGIGDFEFRPAKRDKFRVVQKKERRIKAGGEIKEILKSRKSGRFFK